MSQAWAIDSAVAFLTGNHVVQIKFDQILPSAGPSARSGNEIIKVKDCKDESGLQLILSRVFRIKATTLVKF